MSEDIKGVIARGLKSEFWRLYVRDVLEPERELVKAALLKQGPPDSSDFPKICYYRGAYAILERLEKKFEGWLV